MSSTDSDNLIEVWCAQGDLDAQLVQALLASNGIPSSLAGETLRITHGFTLNRLGQVRILVRPADAEAARQVLEEALKSGLNVSEESEDD